jgi:3-oxoacyl-[acyl-carrier-protein] synthase II
MGGVESCPLQSAATLFFCMRQVIIDAVNGELPRIPARVLRRVVVTGLGLVTPLGVGVPHVWGRLLRGETGVCASEEFGVPLARVPRTLAAAGAWDASLHVPRAESRALSPDYIAFALGAAGEALGDAGLLPAGYTSAAAAPSLGAAVCGRSGGVGPYAALRVGSSIGCGVGGLEELAAGAVALAGGAKLSPFFVPRTLVNMAAGGVALRFGLRGPNLAPSTACASGAHAVGDAARAIAWGDADAMVAGGSEATLGKLAIAGFGRARALSSVAAAQSSGPFSAGRDGFVLGEGAGCLVLESLECALARGARVYGEVRGYGTGGDAFHITSPRPDGSGAHACMARALEDGGLTPSHVGYVNAHATGTPTGDGIEAKGIADLWRGVEGGVRVSSTKGAVGHLLGAAGAVEAVFSVLALHHGVCPATVGLGALDPALEALEGGGGGAVGFLGKGGDGGGGGGVGGHKAVI